MKTLEQWREELKDYPHLTQEDIIKSTYWMYRNLRKNGDEDAKDNGRGNDGSNIIER